MKPGPIRPSVRRQVGPWLFDANAHELIGEHRRVRLERRASMTLTLLADAEGNVVSQQAILDHGWSGRSVSPNSVPIVIADLRRALAIEDGAPGAIETIPKAGYRLLPTLGRPGRSLRRAWAVLLLVAVLALAGLTYRDAHARPTIAVGAIDNQIGDTRSAALIKACNAQVLVELGRRNVRVDLDPARAATANVALTQRWVLWSGHPELVLVATDPRTGQALWSGAIYGDEHSFPAKIGQRIAELDAALNRGR